MHSNFHVKLPQLQIVKAEKQYMTDNVGAQYLDCISNISHVGHCHPQVIAALHSQFSKLVTPHGLISDKYSLYSKKLTSTLPDPLCVCYLVNSGSEANDLALRLARAYTKNEDVLVFDEAYHGNLGSLIDISPQMLKELGQTKKSHLHILSLPDTFNGPYKDEDDFACEKYISDAKKILAELPKKGRHLACLISEMFIVNCGIVIPPQNYFKRLYKVVRDLGGICIADEVQTGLGRLGQNMWAFQYFDVTPDIVTIGKPLGNGYPMGAVITTTEISDALGPYYSTVMAIMSTQNSQSFGGNPVSCAVGLAVLEIIQNEMLLASGKAVGRTLREGLMRLKDQRDCVGDVRGRGLCIGVEIVTSKASRKPDAETAENIVFCLKERHHIVVQVIGPHKNVLSITPPMCFTQQNARTLVSALDEVLSSMASGSLHQSLPGTSLPTLGVTDPVITSDSLLEAACLELDSSVPFYRMKRAKTSYDDVD